MITTGLDGSQRAVFSQFCNELCTARCSATSNTVQIAFEVLHREQNYVAVISMAQRIKR